MKPKQCPQSTQKRDCPGDCPVKKQKSHLVKPPIEPRYDDVYFEGVAWIDSLAGCECNIDQNTTFGCHVEYDRGGSVYTDCVMDNNASDDDISCSYSDILVAKGLTKADCLFWRMQGDN